MLFATFQFAFSQQTVVSTIAADCPSNGVITFDVDTCTSFSWIVTGAPNSTYLNLTGNDTFINSLEPGEYIIDLYCDLELDFTDTVTISDNYTTMTQEVTAEDICAGFTEGATIVSTVSGGTAPFQYAIFKGNNANMPDQSGKVQGAYSSDSFRVVTEFGNHVVRVKDACGEFITSIINVQATTPAMYAGVNGQLRGPVCGTNDTVRTAFYLISDNGSNVSTVSEAGMVITVYTGFSGFTDRYTTPSNLGTFFYADTVYSQDELIKVPRSGPFLLIAETACGDVRYNWHEWTTAETTFTSNWGVVNSSCSTTPSEIDLTYGGTTFEVDPTTYSLYNGSGSLVCSRTYASSGCFRDLPTSQGPYQMIVTDACGTTDTIDFTTPSGTGAPTVHDIYANPGCSNVNGRSRLEFKLDGNIPLHNLAVPIVTSGPSNVGDTAYYDRWNNLYEISNLIPGGVYTFTLSYPSSTGCGSLPNQSFNITVPTGDDLDMTMTPVITQLCGGGATVETNFSYNGWSSMSIRMYDSAWNRIDENTSGNFSLYDTTQSKYYVQLYSDITYCPNVDSISLVDSFVLGVQGAPPVIQKKIGVVCENSSGTLLNTGFAGLDAEGAAPFYFEMKLASATTYNAVTGDSMTGELEVQNLFPDTVYSFRVTDACGNAVVTDISVSKLSNVQALNTLQACVGSSYTLRAPGKQSASYDWYKSDSAGNYIFLASGQFYNFPLYAASDDGLYKCEMNFGSNGAGGCVEREFNVNLNSDFCNRSIDLNEINGIVYTDFNEDTVNGSSEPGTENIKVYLYDDVNHNGILEVSELNPPIDSALTTSVGFYSFEVLYDRDTTSYIVKIDTATLPTGSYMTTDNYEYAQFTSGGNLDPNNDFGHSGCDFSSGIAAPSAGCTGEDQVFAVSPPVSGASYAWEFSGGDPATSSAATQIVTWATPGTYVVELEVSDATCSDTIVHSIVISTGMIASAAPNDTVCRGGEVVLDASASTSTGANYVWTVESGDPYSIDAGGNTTAPTVSPYVNSTYKITVTSATSTCANVAFVSVNVDVNRNPTATLSGPTGAIHDSSMVYLDGTGSNAPTTNPTATMDYSWLEDGVGMSTWNYDTMTTKVSGTTEYGLICVDPLNGWDYEQNNGIHIRR